MAGPAPQPWQIQASQVAPGSTQPLKILPPDTPVQPPSTPLQILPNDPPVQAHAAPIAQPQPAASHGGGGLSLAGLGGLGPVQSLLHMFGGHSGGGGGEQAAPTDPYAQYLPHLLQMGYDPAAAQKILNNYRTSVTKAETLKGLPAELQTAINQHDADTAAAQQAQTQNQSLMNPLAMQLFFSNTIAPYLDQLNKGYQQTGQQMRGALNLSHVPPAYRQILQQSVDTKAAGMNNMATALSAATTTGPYVDALNKQLEAAIQAQNYDRYVREREMAYANISGLGGLGGTGTTGTTTAPNAQQQAQINALGINIPTGP